MSRSTGHLRISVVLRPHAHHAACRHLRQIFFGDGVRSMNAKDDMSTCSRLEQVFLVERDAGSLCRILNLYASRGLDVLNAEYACAAPGLMRLTVAVARHTAEDDETLRVLAARAATLVGVFEAAARLPLLIGAPGDVMRTECASRTTLPAP